MLCQENSSEPSRTKHVSNDREDRCLFCDRKVFSSEGLSDGQFEMPKVRKGTHSCWECRRRKVKCVFASPTDGKCITCHRRDSTCTSQSTDSPINTPQDRRHTEGLHDQVVREADDDWNVQSAMPTLVLNSSTEVGDPYPCFLYACLSFLGCQHAQYLCETSSGH